MKKNGFIAMSLVYTFFLVFLVVILSILNFYLDNNAVMKKINKDIMDRYNTNFDGQTMTTLSNKSIIKQGDYVDYQTNYGNYEGGKWQVLKYNSTNVYIVSSFIVANIQSNLYNSADLNDRYGTMFINPKLADELLPLTAADLWSQYSNYELDFNRDNFKLWNISTNYFVLNDTNVHVVLPNCSCGSNNYYTSYLTYPSISQWYDAVCTGTGSSGSDQSNSVVSNCSVKYNRMAVKPSDASGVRLVIKLKNSTILIGGSGSYNRPYRVGGID